MALFPRLGSGDFTPLFRLLDDYDHHRTTSSSRGNKLASIRSFTPSFDVREANDAYYLDGELPGIKQSDIEIEFTDESTLVIKGHVKREYTATNENEAENQPSTPNDETASNKSARQPTVEDEDAPATSPTEPSSDSRVVKHNDNSKAVGKKPAVKFWVSERSVGEFQRTFTFPSRVNPEAVRASLKDGILHIVVPKAAAPASKKIRID